MTIQQRLRNFLGLLLCSAASSTALACSSGSSGPSADSQAGSAGSGAGADSGSFSGSGSSAGGSDAVVGTFQVQILVDADDNSTGMTKVVGQVGDGPVPSTLAWTVVREEGPCKLETPSAPFCEAGCGSDVCVADDVCQAYPTSHSVGDVTLGGAKLMGGGDSLMLKEIASAYQPPAGTGFEYPPFAAGDAITLHASGGDYAAFDLAAQGVDPLIITSTDFELDQGKPFEITWDGAPDPKASEVYLKLDISHHGGIRGMIECTTDDSGTLTLSAKMMSDLIGLGVAGYPSVVLMRQSLGYASIAPGRVKLEVSSRAEHAVTVKGVQSCTSDEDCPDGKTCRTADSTCQ